MLPYHGEIPEQIVTIPGNTYSYAEFCRQLSQLEARYPQLAFFSAGQSVLGKPLWCLKIGQGSRNLHFNAAMHANEWITAPVLLRFAEEYAKALNSGEACQPWTTDAQTWFNRYSLWIMPMVNPDGVDLAQGGILNCGGYLNKLLEWNEGNKDFSRWKANIRGVDLNDQFPAFWETERERRGILSPAAQDYSGTSPLCEPEAAALVRLTEEIKPEIVVSLHSQGKEIYWNYRDFEPDCSEVLADKMGAAAGYRAVKLSGSDAGYKDWFIQCFRRPGFTVEIGEGVNPLPVSSFEALSLETSAILAEVMNQDLF